MDEIIEKLDNKIKKLRTDFDFIKNKIKESELEHLEKIYNLNNDLDKSIETLLELKTALFKNNLEMLEFHQKRDIMDQIIQEKINKIMKPLMLSLYLKFS